MRSYTIAGISYDNLDDMLLDHPGLIFPRNAGIELLQQMGITVHDMPDPDTGIDPELEQVKYDRNVAIGNLIVEVDGIQFDANDTSQDRMLRVLYAINDEPDSFTVDWVCADNNVRSVTKAQLRTAYNSAVEEMVRLHLLPYSN